MVVVLVCMALWEQTSAWMIPVNPTVHRGGAFFERRSVTFRRHSIHYQRWKRIQYPPHAPKAPVPVIDNDRPTEKLTIPKHKDLEEEYDYDGNGHIFIVTNLVSDSPGDASFVSDG